MTLASVATGPSELSYIQGYGHTPVTVSYQGVNPSVTMHSLGVQTQSGTYVGSSSEYSTAPSWNSKEVSMAEFSRLFDQIGLLKAEPSPPPSPSFQGPGNFNNPMGPGTSMTG